jgi:hypothetical protein
MTGAMHKIGCYLIYLGLDPFTASVEDIVVSRESERYYVETPNPPEELCLS